MGAAMNKKGKTIEMILGLVLSAVMPLAAQAQASAPGLYAGVGGGQSEVWDYQPGGNQCDALPTCKKKGSAYKVFGGWQFSRNFGVEITYTDLGKASSSSPGFDQSIKVRASDVMLFAQWPALERLAFFGKVGGYYAQTSVDTTQAGVNTRAKESRGNGTYGAGIQWYITNGLALRGEGQKYMKVGGGAIGDSDYSVYSVSLLYKF
jgi:OmpA-OmpF porin, OOP family